MTECHGTNEDDEDFNDYEDFSLDLIDGDATVYRFYYNENDQGVDNYIILLYTLDDKEVERQILLEII